MTTPESSSGRPVEQAVERPRVDDAVGVDAGEPRVGDRDVRVAPLGDGVRVGVECDRQPAAAAARARS